MTPPTPSEREALIKAIGRVDFRRLADEMRREHDSGDGHFATHEVEGVENICAILDGIAALSVPPSPARGEEIQSYADHQDRVLASVCDVIHRLHLTFHAAEGMHSDGRHDFGVRQFDRRRRV